jgi:DNA-binding NarL/FixJ family response regulator
MSECPLTPVEIQALRLLAAGLTHQEIAERENVGSTAITNRVTRAGRKLGTVTPTQTVVVALCRGYLKKSPYARR